jgi:hypothetical protein
MNELPRLGLFGKVRSIDDWMQVAETNGITPGSDLVNPLIWLSASI